MHKVINTILNIFIFLTLIGTLFYGIQHMSVQSIICLFLCYNIINIKLYLQHNKTKIYKHNNYDFKSREIYFRFFCSITILSTVLLILFLIINMGKLENVKYVLYGLCIMVLMGLVVPTIILNKK